MDKKNAEDNRRAAALCEKLIVSLLPFALPGVSTLCTVVDNRVCAPEYIVSLYDAPHAKDQKDEDQEHYERPVAATAAATAAATKSCHPKTPLSTRLQHVMSPTQGRLLNELTATRRGLWVVAGRFLETRRMHFMQRSPVPALTSPDRT